MSRLQTALGRLLRGMGRLDTETLRYEYGPSAPDTIEPLCEAVRAAEEERAELLAALENIIPRFHACVVAMGSDPEFADEAVAAARAAVAKVRAGARTRGEVAEVAS